jgi:hypothetical protein
MSVSCAVNQTGTNAYLNFNYRFGWFGSVVTGLLEYALNFYGYLWFAAVEVSERTDNLYFVLILCT